MLARYLRNARAAPRLPDAIDPADEEALRAGLIGIGVRRLLATKQAQWPGRGGPGMAFPHAR